VLERNELHYIKIFWKQKKQNHSQERKLKSLISTTSECNIENKNDSRSPWNLPEIFALRIQNVNGKICKYTLIELKW